MTIPYGPILSDAMPLQLGPYSQAVRAGNLLFTSGQAGINPATNAPNGDQFDTQARQAFDNLSTVLRAAGSGLEYVVKTTIFLSDPGNFTVLNALFKEYFPTNPPARSVPIVQLPRGLLISIEAVAVLPDADC
jgi:2-iminobutanoate/2-iminopropanoate deaminase